MRLVDLSHALMDRARAFPNDPKLAVIEFGRIATHQYNVTQLVMGVQLGRPFWMKGRCERLEGAGVTRYRFRHLFLSGCIGGSE